jgi:hypothetical protein
MLDFFFIIFLFIYLNHYCLLLQMFINQILMIYVMLMVFAFIMVIRLLFILNDVLNLRLSELLELFLLRLRFWLINWNLGNGTFFALDSCQELLGLVQRLHLRGQ